MTAQQKPGDARGRTIPLRWLLIPLLVALVAVALGEATDLDRAITRLVYDAQAGAFPLRHTFLLDVVMHRWTKYAVATLGFVMLAAFGLSFVLPARAHRRVLLFVVLAMSLGPLSVAIGKAVSTRHCPWDIDEFGGVVPYSGLLAPPAPGVEPGHCFPAGHASTGFALLAFYFAAYARGGQKAARLALGVGLGAGLLLGFGRVLQGAHFVSHVMWAGLLCWMVMVLLFAMLLSVRATRADSLRA